MQARYEIVYADRHVEKQLRALPKDVFKRFDREIERLRANPRSAKVKKLKGKDAVYELKVWPYRVLFDIDDEIRKVILLEIIHRKDLEKYLKRL